MKISNQQALILFEVLRDTLQIPNNDTIRFTIDLNQRLLLVNDIVKQQGNEIVDLDVTKPVPPCTRFIKDGRHTHIFDDNVRPNISSAKFMENVPPKKTNLKDIRNEPKKALKRISKHSWWRW